MATARPSRSWAGDMGFRRSRLLRCILRPAAVMALACGLLLASLAVSWSSDVPIATVGVGRNPSAIAVDPVTHAVFVTNYWGESVSVIDGSSDTVTATVPMPSGISSAIPNAISFWMPSKQLNSVNGYLNLHLYVWPCHTKFPTSSSRDCRGPRCLR